MSEREPESVVKKSRGKCYDIFFDEMGARCKQENGMGYGTQMTEQAHSASVPVRTPPYGTQMTENSP